MINSSIITEFDIEKIKEKIENNTNLNYSYFYKYYIDDALEFADIIFDNNLDKSNFLKQYIKDGSLEKNYITKEPIYSKKFIK